MSTITLDDLANKYKDRITDFIKRTKNKTVVFDFDGTLTEFRYEIDKMLPCTNSELNLFSTEFNIYENVKLLDTMHYIISILGEDNVIVLTQTVPNLVEHKNYIINHKLNIPKSNIYHVSNPDEKLDMLSIIYDKYEKDIAFVEDNAGILLKAEENLTFVTGIHISSLIA